MGKHKHKRGLSKEFEHNNPEDLAGEIFDNELTEPRFGSVARSEHFRECQLHVKCLVVSFQ